MTQDPLAYLQQFFPQGIPGMPGGQAPVPYAPPQGLPGQLQPPQFAGAGGLQSPGAPGAPSNPYTSAPNSNAQGQWDASQASMGAQQAYLQGQQGLLGLQPQAIAAKANVLQAQQNQLGAQSAYLAEQTRANAQRLQSQQGIQAAQSNVPDILAVARAQNQRNSQSYIYRLGGLPAPVEVEMPPGYQGPMPPGVVARLQTLAEVLTKQANDEDVMLKFNEEAARIRSANSGLEVTAAEIASGRVQLTLDEAELAVQRLGLNAQLAGLAEKQSRQPPAPGLTFDEESGQWLTYAQVRQNNLDRQTALGDQKDAAERIKRGDYGSLSLDTLTSMLTETFQGHNGGMDEATYRSVLASYPFQKTQPEINALISLARARSIRESTGSGGLTPEEKAALDKIGASLGGGGTGGFNQYGGVGTAPYGPPKP